MKKLISLFILLLGFAYLFLVDQYIPSTEERLDQRNRLLFFPGDSLKEVIFNNISLKKEDTNSFLITKPVRMPVNNEFVQNLFLNLKKINYLDKRLSLPEGKSLESVGLKPAKFEVTLKGDAIQSKKLFIGNGLFDTDKTGSTWARLEGDRHFYVISSKVSRLLEAPIEAIVSLSPFSFFEKGDGIIEWTLKNENYCRLLKENNFFSCADRTREWQAIQKKARQFATVLKSLQFNPAKAKKISDTESGIQSTNRVLKVQTKAGQQNLYIGKDSPSPGHQWVKLGFKQDAFEVDSRVLKLFDLSFEDLYAKTFFEASLSNFQQIDFVDYSSQKKYIFTGKDTAWMLHHPYQSYFHQGKILSQLLKLFISPIKIKKEPFSFEKPLKSTFTFVFTPLNQAYTSTRIDLFVPPLNKGLPELMQNKHPTRAVFEKGLDSSWQDFDPFGFINPLLMKQLLEEASIFEFEYQNIKSRFEKTNWDTWESNEKEKTSFLSYLKKLENLKIYNSFAQIKGVDFGFEKPLLRLTFLKRNQEKPFMSVQVGSFSNKKDAYLSFNQKFIAIVKGFELPNFTHPKPSALKKGE